MLNFRVNTFLELCRCGSYTKTAAKLHMTQPAVTQHIQYLEKIFQVKLFHYAAKELTLTKQGKLLFDFAGNVETNLAKLREHIQNSEMGLSSICLGTTENIGEYIMPGIISAYLAHEKCDDLKVMIGSTDYLLGLLQEGKIKFAIVDGQFDKKAFNTELLFVEKTVVICATDHRYARKTLRFCDLLEETLIMRPKGSAPRTNIEQFLKERNLSVEDFSNHIEIDSLNITKKFVQKGMGIAFIYHHAIKDDAQSGLLGYIDVPDFNMLREINYVELKDDYFRSEYETFLEYCRQKIDTEKLG
jgi:DNA-binding transcriptional LysR family regulator